MEKITKVLLEGNPTQTVATVPKIWRKYKQNEKVVKGKHNG